MTLRHVYQLAGECDDVLVKEGYRRLSREETEKLENRAMILLCGSEPATDDFSYNDQMEIQDFPNGDGYMFRKFFLEGAREYYAGLIFFDEDQAYACAFKRMEEVEGEYDNL